MFEETLFANIEMHCDIKDHVVETVDSLRAMGIKIGSTTGYTTAMMELVLPKAAMQGYAPDFCMAPDQTVKGRPLFDLGSFDFDKLYAALKAKGFIIYPGKLTTIPTFRLGNIGDVYPSDMAELVKTVGEYIG